MLLSKCMQSHCKTSKFHQDKQSRRIVTEFLAAISCYNMMYKNVTYAKTLRRVVKYYHPLTHPIWRFESKYDCEQQAIVQFPL